MLSPSELNRLVVVLVSPRNPLNIGAAARAMTNFGVHRLRVVNPYEVAFRGARSAVGAAELLQTAEQFSEVSEAIADCSLIVGTTAVRHRDLQHPLRRLDEDGGSLIRERLQGEQVALLFGSEKYGLSNEDLSHCHWLLNIPTHDGNISMNLGQSVAVCLYELARNVDVARPGDEEVHTASGETERITKSLLDVLHASGFIRYGSEHTAEEKSRRFVRRMNLQAADAKVMLGMLRRVLWKLKSRK